MVVVAACGAKLSATDSGASASGVTPLPACSDASAVAPKEPVCGGELTSCDPGHPQGLPVGACTAGATCDVRVRYACACPDELGPLFPWRCACVDGTWDCRLDPPGARSCSNECLADAGTTCPKPAAIAPPGPRVTTRAALGTGACAGKSLGSAIDAIHAANPSLADIATVYDPEKITTDGSFVYAFRLSDGFALALKRGGGDCPAGCTENEYWYFQTDAACAPKQVGHYHPTYGSGCVNVDGAAMWATPAPLDPKYVCGSDTTAQDISGTYAVCMTGNKTACSVKGGDEPTVAVNGNLTVKIAQRPDDRSKGTVTVTGTGHPKIDGVPFDATFMRRRFAVTASYSNLPAKCPDEWQLSIELDFEGVAVPGKLSFFEMHAVGCSETIGGGDYCKGIVGLQLYPP